MVAGHPPTQTLVCYTLLRLSNISIVLEMVYPENSDHTFRRAADGAKLAKNFPLNWAKARLGGFEAC